MKKVPLLPLSAIIFYFLTLILVLVGILPQPEEIINLLEKLYENYGLVALFVAAFFEGIVYVGLYFAGSFIILFVILFSNGSLLSLLIISTVVTLALIIASIVNYVLGRYFKLKSTTKKIALSKRKVSGGFLLSFLHPNSLAFYFFNLGINKRDIWQIFLIPFIMIPYGFLLGFLFYQLKPIITKGAENPYILIIALLVWFIIAFILKNKEN